MAHGAPDWQYNVLADVIAQTIGNLAVDIQAQTIATLAVDIAAQALTNLNVNINKQDLATLAVDIAAATIGNIGIDVKAQTIAQLGIDIEAQTLDIVTNRPTYGGAISGDMTTSKSASAWYDLLTISGTGMIYGGVLKIDGGSGDEDGVVSLRFDGISTYNQRPFDLMYSASITSNNLPIYLIKYDPIEDIYVVGFGFGYTFETGLVVKAYQATANTVVYSGEFLYATV